ncbi:MAG: TolC family protein [Deltaproteobacteria bacterium]|nr:TolC family protein [Deltaproteobacteria bacterium]
MRFARLVFVLAAALLASPRRTHADLIWRIAQDPGGGGAPAPTAPTNPDDLSTWAGPARPTSLPALLKHAIQNAPSLKNAKLDIEIAEARIEQTFGRDDWQIRAILAATRSTGGFFGGQALDQNITVQGTADVFRVLPTGGTLNFRAATNYNNTSFQDPAADDLLGATNWQHQLTASYTQPLFRNRGRLVYDAQERRATLSREVSVLARRVAAIQTVQAVVSAYWDLILSERQVGITRASLDLARERLRITQIGADGGKIPRSEIPAVQQIIATREEELLTAELGVLDRSIALRRLVNLPIGRGELGLRIGGELAIGAETPELGGITERAFAAAPELAQLAKQDASAKLDIEVTEQGLLPRLDATLFLGPIGQDERFGKAIKNMVTFDTFTVGGQVLLEHSIGQENVRGIARESRVVRQKLEVTATDIRAQIAQTMARAVAQLELARRRVALSQRAIDLANENIKIEADRFNLGKATNFDVLNRQEELRQSELRKAQAMIDWHKAEAIVQALTGDLLPAYGISVD